MAITQFATPHSLDEIDRANVDTGFRLARSLALQNAALDQRLPPACVRVMAAISYFMNDKTMRAWPGYDLLAEVSGYSYDVIDRSIRKLKATGYLRTQRHAPITGGRALVHYGYGKIDPEFLERLVTDAVAKIKERKADADKKVRVGVTPTKKSWAQRLTPTFSSTPDSDILYRQEPIKNRNSISEVLATKSSQAAEQTVLTIDEVKPAKRKARATGKRPWEWVHENEKRDLFERCRSFAEDRAWSAEFLAERLKAFAAWQNSRRPVSADWWAELELWLGNPSFQPKTTRSNRRSSLSDLMDEVPDEKGFN